MTPVKLKVETEEELQQVAHKAIHILVNYIASVEKWREEYGSRNKIRMIQWKERADALIKTITVKEEIKKENI